MRRMRHLKPREIQGCAIALDASISGSLYDATSGGSLVAADGAVARWEDQSGNARHVTQGTSGQRPLRRVKQINGVDAVEFDGNDDNLSVASQNLTDYLGSGQNTVVSLVLKQRSAQANNIQIRLQVTASNTLQVAYSYSNILYFDPGRSGAPGRVSVAQPSGWDDNPHVTLSWRSGANGAIWSDNKQLVSSASFSDTASSSATFRVGLATSETHEGEICEVAIWNSGLSDFVRMRTWQSRMRKWRING
jgi:hypothetical protein